MIGHPGDAGPLDDGAVFVRLARHVQSGDQRVHVGDKVLSGRDKQIVLVGIVVVHTIHQRKRIVAGDCGEDERADVGRLRVFQLIEPAGEADLGIVLKQFDGADFLRGFLRREILCSGKAGAQDQQSKAFQAFCVCFSEGL